MNVIPSFFHSNTGQIVTSAVLFILTLFGVFVLYQFVLNRLKKRAAKTQSGIDNFVIDLMRIPVLWLLFWIIFKVFSTYSFLSKTSFYGTLTKINNILLILTIGWILIKIVRAVFYYFENKLNTDQADSNARGGLTKMKIFEGIIVAIITVVIVAICLMTFDKIRAIGISLLTSAGIAGIIAGFAAQKSIGAIFAGIQIALTQPIRLDDQVVVEGQNGIIEEITLTYVVVKTWDEKRLILPVQYFLDNPFQNWTRNTGNILGTVFLYLDYSIPVDALRKQLATLLDGHPKWDKRVGTLVMTDSKENYVEIRLLLSSSNSSYNADLQVDIREKMIDFIQKEYPGCFVKTRITGELRNDVNTPVKPNP